MAPSGDGVNVGKSGPTTHYTRHLCGHGPYQTFSMDEVAKGFAHFYCKYRILFRDDMLFLNSAPPEQAKYFMQDSKIVSTKRGHGYGESDDVQKTTIAYILKGNIVCFREFYAVAGLNRQTVRGCDQAIGYSAHPNLYQNASEFKTSGSRDLFKNYCS